jgi:hypothetical protein
MLRNNFLNLIMVCKSGMVKLWKQKKCKLFRKHILFTYT